MSVATDQEAPVSLVPPLHVRVEGDARARAVFSGRGGGTGNVSLVVGAGDAVGARVRLAQAAGVDPGALVFMEQVHGSGVAVVGHTDRGRGLARHAGAVPGVDALVSFDDDVACVVMVADCVPVLLVDPGRAVAAVHAGRAGTAAGVIAAALEVLAPPDPAAVTAAVGPAIGGCCYEVPEELAREVASRVPGVRAETTWGTPSLDLPAGVEGQLRRSGVERIWRADVCTRCSAATWFSHRAAPDAGRQAGVVCRTGDLAAIGGRTSLDWDA